VNGQNYCPIRNNWLFDQQVIFGQIATAEKIKNQDFFEHCPNNFDQLLKICASFWAFVFRPV